MRILIANDDGIASEGLLHLARAAARIGETIVVAPKTQCSSMSQRISVFGSIELHEEKDFGVEGVRAYSLSGTPADCVKVALARVMKERPDIVLSGINNGYNVGLDILYSGTVGVTMEALANGIPAMAFSADSCEDLRVADLYMEELIRELIKKEIKPYEVWNINFPSMEPDKIKGLLYDRKPSIYQYYQNRYTPTDLPCGGTELSLSSELRSFAEEGSDMEAVLSGCISIGKLENALLRNAAL